MQDNQITALLVDDDEEYVRLVKQLLRPFQNKTFNIIWETDGEKTIEYLRTNPEIDIVLMEHILPNKNGLQLIKQIFDEGIVVPVVLLTTNKDLRDAIDAIKSGVADYLVKEEMTDTVLPRTIINLLEGAALRKQIRDAEDKKFFSQRRNEAIQELIVTMCHEFNNPLAAIKISTEILMRQKTGEQNRLLLEDFMKKMSNLEKQITDLRDLNALGQLEK